MDYPNSPGAVASRPADQAVSGTPGYYRRGEVDRDTGVLTETPSELERTWLNDLTANLYAALHGLEPNPPNRFVAGSAGDSGFVDALRAAAFDTGDVKFGWFDTAPAGWVLMDDGTIGDTGSGASTLADPSAESLFTVLWDNYADAECPVSSGRGASAAADWGAGENDRPPDGPRPRDRGGGDGLRAHRAHPRRGPRRGDPRPPHRRQ